VVEQVLGTPAVLTDRAVEVENESFDWTGHTLPLPLLS